MDGQRKYSVIYADPPWKYDDASEHRGGAIRHYPTMTTTEIARMNVQGIAARDCALFLWITDPFIARGTLQYVVERWGFTLKTKAFTWIKTNEDVESIPVNSTEGLSWGMGHWTRANPETCWLATRGRPKRHDRGVHSVIVAPRGRHSEKPDEARHRIDRLCGDVPRIELFARKRVPGWDAWGNEV